MNKTRRHTLKKADRISLLIFFMMGLVLFMPAGKSAAADPRKMTFPPVEFHPPRAERVVLDNGMILYLLENHELPLIRVNALIRTGGVFEPPDKTGLASLTGEVMRTGGTKKVPGDQMDEELEFIAAGLSSFIGRDSGFAGLNILRKDFDRGLELFSDMLMNPVFPEDKIDLAKKQALEEIRRRNDQPSQIATRAFFKTVYGREHPLARQDSVESITAIKREDLVRFHSEHYRPGAVILSASGDFTRDSLISKIEKAFSGWEGGTMEPAPLPPPAELYQPSVRLVNKDLSQTHIRVGHIGIREDDPDFFAVSILDDILGAGGFKSRLFKEVRTNLGLAYSVGSVFTAGDLERGVFLAYCETKADSTHRALTAIIKEIERIREEPVSEDEIRLAREAFLNSFVFSFSSPEKIVNRQASLEFDGLPADFLDRFRDGVLDVTREDIQRVAGKFLQPEGLTIVAVGNPEQFDRPLSEFGEVQVIGPGDY